MSLTLSCRLILLRHLWHYNNMRQCRHFKCWIVHQFLLHAAYDYEQVDTTLPGLAGGFVDPPSLSVETYQDGIAEQSEGFVLLLEIMESDLDPRDLESVSLSRSVYLVRINQSGIVLTILSYDS